MLQGKKKNITIIVVGVLNFILTIGAMIGMDKRLPINIFKEFVLDKMVQKENLLIIPAVVLVLCALQVFYRLKTMDKTVTRGKIIEDAVFTFVIGVLILLGWLLVDVGYQYMPNHRVGFETPVLSVVLASFAIVISTVASTFPINKFKDVIGFNTKETKADESIWRVTNRFAGFAFFVSAIILVILAVYFALNPFKWTYLAVGVIVALVFMFYAPTLYAKNIYNRKYKEEIEK